MTLLYALKNGFHIPLLFPFFYFATGDSFLSTIITLKLFPLNYYYWFEDQYNHLPRGYNWIKQTIRFTDTGHIVSFMAWLNPQYLPVAFTTHFVITFGYWFGKLYFGMNDCDDRTIPDLEPVFEMIWTSANHGLPLLLFSNKIIISQEPVPFTFVELQNSYAWLHTWFLCAYIPWRLFTGDIVYNVLDYRRNTTKTLWFVGYIHFLIFMGHMFGFAISNINNINTIHT